MILVRLPLENISRGAIAQSKKKKRIVTFLMFLERVWLLPILRLYDAKHSQQSSSNLERALKGVIELSCNVNTKRVSQLNE